MIPLLLQGAADVIPWDKLIAGGAGVGLMTGVLIWVVTHVGKQHDKCSEALAKVTDRSSEAIEACNATIKSTTENFAKSVQDSTAKFSETTLSLVREARDSHVQREQQLIAALRDKNG